MPAKGALAIFVAYVVWLFIRDTKRRTQHSAALWIPLIWIVLIGSRPLSLWFGYGRDVDSGNDYVEGNPLDRLIFLGLILAGAFVVVQRRNNFQSFIANNRALFWFFAFWGLSVVWADSSFVALKRWIKDLGNVVMVLVILSEKDPVGAIKTIFARCTYLFFPFSVLLIKWYPALGSYYNRWTGDAGHQGVSTNKNLLGVTLTV